MSDLTYEPGDVITYRPWRDPERTVLVQGQFTDNGTGFHGVLVHVEDGAAVPTRTESGLSEVWGYDFQVTGVVMKS